MKNISKLGFLVIILSVILSARMQSHAQVATTAQSGSPQEQTPRTKKAPTARSTTAIVENRPGAPQVVTILHRLNGLKMFRLLVRSGDVQAIARLDDAFNLNSEVHTNVIAGLAFDDGQTIAAWLPEADAEIGPPSPPEIAAPKEPAAAISRPSAPNPPGQATLPAVQTLTAAFGTMLDPPDLTVISRNGKRLWARYIGLDAVTGLSVLQLSQRSLAEPASINPEASEGVVKIGERVYVFGPEPASEREALPSTNVYVRMGESEGQISGVTRAPSGGIARLRIVSPSVSGTNIGSIVINEVGETLGIVDAVMGHEATVLPAAIVRSAAKRVLERQASVPRPWLGIRGEALEGVALEQLLRNGWKAEPALSLFTQRRGILLTSVTPGSPASLAALQPGDVIVSVNEDDVRSADEFSWSLEEAGPGGSVRFTVARPGRPSPEAVELRLSESLDPFFGMRTPEGMAAKMASRTGSRGPWPGSLWSSAPGPSADSLGGSLLAHGIETIALKPTVAARFGSAGGLLVVYVQPATAMFRAGLRPGDVIEAIDGQQLLSILPTMKVSTNASFSVVRNKEKLKITLVAKQRQD